MGKVSVISIALLLFIGCDATYKVQTPTGERHLTMEEALTHIDDLESLQKLYDQWDNIDFHSDSDGEKLYKKSQELHNRERYYEALQYQRRQSLQHQQQRQQQELYEKEQEAKFKRLNEEWDKFIQNGDGSLKNKTTQGVKKLVDQWKHPWDVDADMIDWVLKNTTNPSDSWSDFREKNKILYLEVFSLENFYKIFGKPYKTRFTSKIPLLLTDEDKYYLWYICKGGYVQITVGAKEFDEGWVKILDLNIL